MSNNVHIIDNRIEQLKKNEIKNRKITHSRVVQLLRELLEEAEGEEEKKKMKK